MKLKKAAMFGLDARIALAIFGALSVISGAALYSAIKQAKTEQLRQYFVEHFKAIEQYYLDNGKPMPQYTANVIYTPDLVQNRENLSTWNGPYIDFNIRSTSVIIDNTSISIDPQGVFQMLLALDSTWPSTTAHNNCTVGAVDCSMYMALYGGSAAGEAKLLELFKDLDALVDGSDGQADGTVRFTSVNYGYLMYKGYAQKRVI